jgi:hypothetical protein
MKEIKYIVVILTVLFAGNSCSDDFLDKSPTKEISIEDFGKSAKKNNALYASTLNGLYTMMFATGTGGTSNHTDFGQKGWDIYSDMLSSDMALSVNTYGWYSDFTKLLVSVDYTDTGNYMPWRYYYRIIRSTNLIIESFGGNDVVPEGESKYSMGQARAMRAYAYFNLSQLYVKEYDESAVILPIYDSPNQQNQAQSSLKEVFDFIINDLELAISYLDGFERLNKNEVNRDVARGLLAYVYAAQGTTESRQKAKKLAEDIISGGTFPLTSKDECVGGFNDVTTPSWMWGVDITPDNGLSLISWWGQMDIYTYSYSWAGDRKAIDQSLFNAIHANDIRKTQFYNKSSSGYHLVPNGKFYHPDKNIGGQRTIETDYLYMRVDEMYLLSAEMSAKSGDDAAAKTRLKEVLALRFDNAADYANVDNLSGQSLLDEILLQSRIELWGEGKSYLLMKRNKLTTVRGSNHLVLVGEQIPYNDERLTLEIPQSEIQNNPNIK